MGDTAALRVFAPAKINLSLNVVGARADGYHLLESLVVFAGVGDWITARPAGDIALTVTGPFAGDLPAGGGDNLVLKAARLLAAAAGGGHGAHLTLEKNLPVASGIGGGSSDAAATLVALSRLWGTALARLPDAELAAKLGADVPVCLRGAPTLMRGIGEILTPAPGLPPAWLVLVNPGQPLATRAVFAALKGRTSAPAPEGLFHGLAGTRDLAAAIGAARNDLSEPAQELMPEIGDVLEALRASPGCLTARMSGSGPTCFGVYGEENEAAAAAGTLGKARPDWWVAPAPLLQPPV